MPQNDDGSFTLPSRDKIRDDFLRDYRFRKRSADTSEGTEPWVVASAFADAMAPAYAELPPVADSTESRGWKGGRLVRELGYRGTALLPASGATGAVVISASSAGTTIFADDEIRNVAKNLRYRCTTTRLYVDGDDVPVAGIDTGPSTNADAGTVLQWTSPRPGCAPKATVFEQADGSGLAGGRNAESEDEARKRLLALNADPAGGENLAQIRKVVRQTPNVPIEEVFLYPAMFGPSTILILFTVRPARAGAGRCPTPVQVGLVQAFVTGELDASDGLVFGMLVEQPTAIVLDVTWSRRAAGWIDAAPWPPKSTYPVLVDGAGHLTPSAGGFSVITTDSSVPTPVPGRTVGFWDGTTGTFRAKRILTVTAAGIGRWDITCDLTNAASDPSYVPVGGQRISAWSDSLQSIAPTVLSEFDALGPGEMVATPLDPGLRQRRDPESPGAWPNAIGNRFLAPVFDLPTVGDGVLTSPTVPYVTPVGSGIVAKLLALSDLAVYPE